MSGQHNAVTVISNVSEKNWQQTVLDLLRVNGYHLIFHDRDSRQNAAGWPDIVAIRLDPPDLIYAELKTNTGRLRPAQHVWLDALAQVGQSVYVWRPRDFDEIVKRLAKASSR